MEMKNEASSSALLRMYQRYDNYAMRMKGNIVLQMKEMVNCFKVEPCTKNIQNISKNQLHMQINLPRKLKKMQRVSI